MVQFSEARAHRHNYKLYIASKWYLMNQNSRVEVGEVFDVFLHTYFLDTAAVHVIIETDVARYYAGSYVLDGEFNESSRAAPALRQFRHTLDVVAREGLLGTMFRVIVEKPIPESGVFDYFGADFNIIPRPEYGPEFIADMGAKVNGWS